MILSYLSEFGLLNASEIEAFKEEFGRYLITNGISSDKWEELKEKNFDTAEQILHLFSVNALKPVLSNIKCLSFRSSAYAQFIGLGENEMEVYSLSAMGPLLDLTTEIDLDKLGTEVLEAEYKVVPFGENREQEILDLCGRGFRKEDEEVLKMLRLKLSS